MALGKLSSGFFWRKPFPPRSASTAFFEIPIKGLACLVVSRGGSERFEND